MGRHIKQFCPMTTSKQCLSSLLNTLEQDYQYKQYITTCDNMIETMNLSCKIFRIPEDISLPKEITDSPCFRRCGRVFYTKETTTGTTKDILYCSEYKISKFLVGDRVDEKILDNIAVSVLTEDDAYIKTFFASNDGPLMMVFKVMGKVFIQLMRCHKTLTFERTFREAFELKFHYALESLFNESVLTSSWCYMFRFGDGVLSTQCNLDKDRVIYCGTLRCLPIFHEDEMEAQRQMASLDKMSDNIHMDTELFSIQDVIFQLSKKEHNFVSFAYPGGECQIFGLHYMRRLSSVTGYTLNEIFGLPLSTQIQHYPIQLERTQFPPLLDILSLYILCGVDTSSPNLTVKGYKCIITKSGNNAVAPLKGFYSYCAASGVDPKQLLPFGPSVWQLREAIKEIFLSGISQPHRFAEKFKQAEDLLRGDVSRILDIASKNETISRFLNIKEPANTPLELIDPYTLLRIAKFRRRIGGVVEEEILKLVLPTTATIVDDKKRDNEDWIV